MPQKMYRIGFYIFCCIVLPETSSAREMIYRRDVVHPPGYNTGTGRFVDEDRSLAIEVDAYTPAKASLTSGEKNRVQEWGAELQYNLGPVAVGAEFWFGEYAKLGHADSGAFLANSESYDILYNRYQLMLTGFSHSQQMKGWYAKGGYSYTKIDMATNLTNLASESNSSVYNNLDEMRHGLTIASGYRFTFLANRCSLNLGVSHTKTVARDVQSPSQETVGRLGSILASAGDKRLAVKDFPEIRLAVGLLF